MQVDPVQVIKKNGVQVLIYPNTQIFKLTQCTMGECHF